MPPLESKLPDEKLALLRSWIAQGALATANSAPTVLAKRKAPAPRTRIKQLVSASRRKGPPPMPVGLSVQPRTDSLRPPAVRGLAVSPTAPLVAVSGHGQILLYHLDTAALLGVLPFDHGTPQALQFSIDGSLLVCAGGRAGESGIAVAYDVRTGEPLGEFGAAYDALLAVAISPDGALIATGGPSRKVRVYHTDTGQPAYEITAHNDWILALAFNEWGDLLATGDRSGGLFVWESDTGREVHALRGHTGAVSAVSFHGESDTLASAGEDGTVRLWEMEEGGQVKSWKAHDKASLDVVFAADGRLATAGADQRLRVWKQDGSRVMNVEKLSDWGYRAAFSGDAARVLVGTWDGVVGIYDTATGKPVGQLTTRPIPPTPQPPAASTTQATTSKPPAPGVAVAATAAGASSGNTTAGAGAASATAVGVR